MPPTSTTHDTISHGRFVPYQRLTQGHYAASCFAPYRYEMPEATNRSGRWPEQFADVPPETATEPMERSKEIEAQ
ncbi:hypothetical protein SNOG_00317 [Parastagonospora nodorum SN15]|uniref:Uncharacterized protein n=1 Tax=Phaeosphaeria nodorum (strain SN15 / ATCC MYA-4574 / FGSC 10173) TaxID=321614 RepID=Q0V6P7_PHANO|nr:hypothetical protein SNOG_00317 [Parastagonospora nodorum SN15]EAT91812.1 hypothetical protein SNOG_00317 [Parastagonospora nodorum SN15]